MNADFTPFFVRLKRAGTDWHAFSGKTASEPLDAVQLVVEVPEFLSAALTGRPTPRAAMVAPGVESNRVLVVLDEAGGVVLAGCPEPEKMGALAGEMLAASAKLWHQKYEALARPFEGFLGMSLADWIGARAGAGWSAEKSRLGTEEALSRGKFPLVIVSAQPDQSVQEALAYLRGMNLEVHVLGFEHQTDRGDELARPMAVELAVATATPAAPSQPEPVRPEPAARLGQAVTQRIELDEHVRTATIGTPGQPVKPFGVKTREYAPFPASNATPKQQEVLERLLPLDELGMERRGFEYFVPKAAGKAAVEGTIVVAIDPERWPFPTEDEVIVVVNTGQEFLAAFLKIPPAEAEEFLASLPRVERKEHKGSLLLRAANTHEATQLVNELRALREVSAGG